MQSFIDNKYIHNASNPGLFQIEDYLNKESIDESFDISILNICNDFLENGDLTLVEVITKLEQIKTQYQVILAQLNVNSTQELEELEEDFDDYF